jgi:putative transposase
MGQCVEETHCALGEVGNSASILQSGLCNWQRIITLFDYPPEIREVIYRTSAIESVNMSLGKLTKNRGPFPSDKALSKLFYLARRNISQK